MKIRSLLLGSVAAVGLSTAAFATDLGVETSLDVCDALGLSGLTISSDTNCLQITGEVTYEFNWGDYAGIVPGMIFFDLDNANYTLADDNNNTDSSSTTEYWLQFVATADSSFGPATATLKLKGSNGGIAADQAWVGIGDTTMLMAGMKDSIFKDGDDEPLNFLGLFNSSEVDAGVSAHSGDSWFGGQVQIETGGQVIQVVSDLGNGLWIGGGLEDLGTGGEFTAVGVLAYSDDNVSAHVSFAADQNNNPAFDDWVMHAGLTGSWDNFKFVGALATNSDGWWNTLGSASATFDMFTIAVSGEMTSNDEWGVGGSLGATVSDGVTLNLGARYFENDDPNETLTQVAAQIVASVTDEITLTGEIGGIAGTGGNPLVLQNAAVYYAKGEAAWAPGGGFTSSIAGEVNSLGAYKATFKAAKTIE